MANLYSLLQKNTKFHTDYIISFFDIGCWWSFCTSQLKLGCKWKWNFVIRETTISLSKLSIFIKSLSLSVISYWFAVLKLAFAKVFTWENVPFVVVKSIFAKVFTWGNLPMWHPQINFCKGVHLRKLTDVLSSNQSLQRCSLDETYRFVVVDLTDLWYWKLEEHWQRCVCNCYFNQYLANIKNCKYKTNVEEVEEVSKATLSNFVQLVFSLASIGRGPQGGKAAFVYISKASPP